MTAAVDAWRVTRMRGPYNISHPWIAKAPGCPNERHPHRWCACKVHRTKADAEAHHAGDIAKADQIRTHLANEHGIHVGELPGEEV